ncbi:MAG: DUF1073 domain-containing protein [Thermodesulfobacteriota bacterium]|nr:DUF1073 domain-containing protein [Thermodesulfobacteriota bacterium]
MARAVIDKPVDASWQGGFHIEEGMKEEETALEKAWKDLSKNRDLNIISKLKRLDKLIGIGEYAVLLFGLSDAKTRLDFANPTINKAELLYLRPLGENNAVIDTLEEDTSNSRYGLPLYYSATLGDENIDVSFRVHYTRILHVAGDVLEGTIKGQSRLASIYNRLIDLEKLVGGSAEMFWRGARPGYQGKVDQDYTLGDTEEDELQDQLDEYEHNLRRFLISRGIDISAMETQISDPSKHVDVQVQMISAQTGIPKRILTGSERGELSSSQDIASWNALVEGRRSGFVENEIIRPFLDMCMRFGVLPPAKQPNDFSVVWNQPMFEQSAKEKAEVGKIRATALKEYASQPMAESIVPPDAFYKYFLGLTEEQVDVIKDIQEKAMKEEGEEEE